MQPYIINANAVADWWRSAMESANQQMKHLVENNDNKSILAGIEESLINAIPDTVSDDDRQAFIEQAMEAAKSDPLHLMFGRLFAEVLSEFMSSASDGSFREVAGTTITVSPLTNHEGEVRGVEINRSKLCEQDIQDIASNGISGIEDFLKSRVKEQ